MSASMLLVECKCSECGKGAIAVWGGTVGTIIPLPVAISREEAQRFSKYGHPECPGSHCLLQLEPVAALGERE